MLYEIQTVWPREGCVLRVQLRDGQRFEIDFSNKLRTVRFGRLKDPGFFSTAVAEEDYVVWGGGELRVGVSELMELPGFPTERA